MSVVSLSNVGAQVQSLVATKSDLTLDASDAQVIDTGTDVSVVTNLRSRVTVPGDVDWSRTIDGSGAETGYGVATDAGGNVYVTGRYVGTATVWNGATALATLPATNASSYGAFVVKLTGAGGVDWTRTIDGSSSDFGQGVAADASGNVYVTGFYAGTATVWNGATALATLPATNASSNGAFVVKLTSAGDLGWTRTIDGSSTDQGLGAATDAGGNVYVTGYYAGTATVWNGATALGTLPAASGSTAGAFVVKFTGNGDLGWTRTIDGSSIDYGQGVATDAGGNVYVTGYYIDTATVWNGATALATLPATSGSSQGAFVVKLTGAGDLGWARTIDGSGIDIGYGVATDAGGNVYVAGRYAGTATVWNGATALATLPATNASSNGALVVKFTSAGDLGWTRTIDGSSDDQGRGVATDAGGNVYVTGYYAGTATVWNDTTSLATLPATNASSYGAFVVKFTSVGDLGWTRTIDGSGGDQGLGVATDASGNVYVTGYYVGTATVWNGATALATLPATNASSTGAFVVKLTGAGGTTIIVPYSLPALVGFSTKSKVKHVHHAASLNPPTAVVNLLDSSSAIVGNVSIAAAQTKQVYWVDGKWVAA